MKGTISTRKALAIVLSAIVLTAVVTYVFAASSNIPITIGGGIYPGAPSYTIWREGTHYFAKNSSGVKEFSGTNATQVITQAMDTLTAGRTWKERVVLKGNFEITSTIFIPSYTVLDLRNAYLTLADDADVTVIDTKPSAVEVEIIGGIIDGNKVNQNPTGEIYGIRLNSASNSTIVGTKVINTHYDGIIVAGGLCNKIINVHVKGCGHNGVTFWSNDRTTYRGHLGIGIISEDNVLEGVGLGTVGGVIVSDLTTSGNSRGVATDEGQDNIIIGHRSDGDDYGAFIAGERIIYESFVIKNPTTRGIIVKPASDNTLPDKIKLDTGIILNSSGHGIDIWDSKLVELENINVNGSAIHGISITGSLNNHEILIRNSIFINNTGSGIRIGSTDAVIKKVAIYNVKATGNSYGIYFGTNTTSEELIVEDSDFRNNLNDAIYIWGSITALKRIKRNLGYVTENSGTATISSGTSVTFSHGLAGTPDVVLVGWQDTGYGTWSWSANSTHITITVTNSGTYDFSWYAEYKP